MPCFETDLRLRVKGYWFPFGESPVQNAAEGKCAFLFFHPT